jgi:serine/threonine protein kinase
MAEQRNEYKLLSRIAHGATGTVHRGRNSLTKTDAAVKSLVAELAHNQGLRKKLVSASAALQRLKHEHVVPILEIVEQGEHLLIVMEYVPGKSLSSTLASATRQMSPEQALPLISQVLKALIYAHAEHTVHGSLKPTDVLLSNGNRVRVEGFGIAPLLGSANVSRAASRAKTLSYIAPEQLKANTPLDPKGDVYSVGIILYQMLTGSLPFAGTSVTPDAHIRHAIAHQPLPDHAVFQELPPALVEIVRRATAKRREERPTAREFLRSLQRFEPQVAAAQLSPPSSSSSASGGAGTGVFGVAGAGAAIGASGAIAAAAASRMNFGSEPNAPLPLVSDSESSSGESATAHQAVPTTIASSLGAAALANPALTTSRQSSEYDRKKSIEPQRQGDDTASQELREALKVAAAQGPPSLSAATVQERMQKLREEQAQHTSSAGSPTAFGTDDISLGSSSSDEWSGVSLGGAALGAAGAAASAFAPGSSAFEGAGSASSASALQGSSAGTAQPLLDKSKPSRGAVVGVLIAGGVLVGGAAAFYLVRNGMPNLPFMPSSSSSPSTAQRTEQSERQSIEERLKYFKDSLANAPEVYADWRDTVEPGSPLWDSLEQAEKAFRDASERASSANQSSQLPPSVALPDKSESATLPPALDKARREQSREKAKSKADEQLAAIKKASSLNKASAADNASESGKVRADRTTPSQPAKSQSSASSSESNRASQRDPKQEARTATPSRETLFKRGSSKEALRDAQGQSSPSRASASRAESAMPDAAFNAGKKQRAAERSTEQKMNPASRQSNEQRTQQSLEARQSRTPVKTESRSDGAERRDGASSSSLRSSAANSREAILQRRREHVARLKAERASTSGALAAGSNAQGSSLSKSRSTSDARTAVSDVGIAERSGASTSTPESTSANGVMILRGHLGMVQSVSFSPDGKLLASGGADKTVKIWDVETGKILRSMRGHDKGVTTVFFSPDGKYVMSGSKDKTVKVWDAATGERIQSTAGISCVGSPTAFSPDGTRLATSRKTVITISRIQPK